ncbi:DUF2968 domain-containing protein [Paraburkholderia tagetis]|uniref:DUF2968 domain-containing protein n=1 Tax=Paraburkholderia tagetis TaxID=2913261 RepID=A0A9X1RQ42_9BURK|nr:DUF2968 domain-containing protein [Paraburkholderia tagetis]
MKSFLNRRSAGLSDGASHVVAVELETQHEATPMGSSARLADGGAVIDDGAPADPETLAPSMADTTAPPCPVSTLHAVPAVPAYLSNRPVQVAEGASFEALAAANELTTFRVFRSFDYAVTLLFHGRTLSYFTTLHQDNTLWHALRTTDLESASAAFHHLEEQATRLAEGETRLAQLAAQNAMLTKQIEQSEAQAERLRVDLQRHAEQEHRVSARQHQVRKDVAQLEAQRVAAQAQLNKAHRTIHQLSVASNEGVPHLPGR